MKKLLFLAFFIVGAAVTVGQTSFPLSSEEHNQSQDQKLSDLTQKVEKIQAQINEPFDWKWMVPIFMFFTVQTGAGLWWASKMTTKVDYLSAQISDGFKEFRVLQDQRNSDFESRLRRLERQRGIIPEDERL